MPRFHCHPPRQPCQCSHCAAALPHCRAPHTVLQARALLPTSALLLLLDFIGASACWGAHAPGLGPGPPHARDGAGAQCSPLDASGPAGEQAEGCGALGWWVHALQHGGGVRSLGGRSSNAASSGPGAAGPGFTRSGGFSVRAACPAYRALLATLCRAWEDVLDLAAGPAAPAYASPHSAPRQPPLPQQAYLSCVVVRVLRRLRRCDVERAPGALGALLQGVSARLASPMPATRRQAMRVGKVGEAGGAGLERWWS